MSKPAFDDRTHLKNWKKEKVAWRRAAKHEKARDLSEWIRKKLNIAADVLGF